MSFLNDDAKILVNKYPNSKFLFNDLNGVYGPYKSLKVLKHRKHGFTMIVSNKYNLSKPENFEILEEVKSNFKNPFYDD